MADMTTPSPAQWLRRLPLAVILLVAATAAVMLRDRISFDLLAEHRATLLMWQAEHAALAMLGFLALYIAVVAFSIPGAAVLSVSGGFLFGLPMGTGLNILAATLGAAVIFQAARLGWGEALGARIDSTEGRLKRLRAGLLDNEISVMLMMRLVPVVPFFVANLLPALVGVRFGTFLWTTALGIVPGALVFTSIGVGLGEVFDRGETPDLSILWSWPVLGPLLGLATLAALPILIKTLRGQKDQS